LNYGKNVITIWYFTNN